MNSQNTITLFKVLAIGLFGITILAQKSVAGPSAKPKYIVIQNVATEKTRVYELCYQFEGCAHKLVFESDMLVGKRDEGDARTLLGVYKINNWVKFYEDGNKKYPSWYDPNYPMPPKAGESARKWFKDKYMPGGNGDMRGAFGWYAATVEPNAYGQWMHGTIGWGADKDEFLNRAKKGFVSIFVDLRSHGCTRHENRAIAYLHHLVPVGTPLIKVYAEETVDDPSLSRYEDQRNPMLFNYALTKDQVRSKKADSSEYYVVMSKINSGLISQADILEQGSYLVDRLPTVHRINEDKSAKSGKSGDVYEVGRKNFRGVFSVDSGRFANYQHPQGLNVGGYQDLLNLPDIVKVK